MSVVRTGVACWIARRAASGEFRRELGIGPLRADLVYASADPYAVVLEIPNGHGLVAIWEFARELLNDGLVGYIDGPTGDVQVRPDGDLRIELSSPSGHAVLWLDTVSVRKFLDATYRAVPAGAESNEINWDRELPALLAGIGGAS